MLYLAGVVLLLVLFVSAPWFPFQLGKLAVFASVLTVVTILFVAGGGARELLRAHGARGAFLVALLPLAYLLSLFFSTDSTLGFVGNAVDTDSVLFVLLGFFAYILAFVLFRTLRTIKILLEVVFFSLLGVAVFQTLVVVFGNGLIPLDVFTDRSINVIGKWNDLGLTMGLLLMLTIGYLELAGASLLRRMLMGALALILVALLAVINFPLVWGFLLGFSIALSLAVFFLERNAKTSEQPASSPLFPRGVPWFAGTGAALALLFLFFGSAINLGITNIFPVQSLEVRPSYSSTLGVMNSAEKASFARVFVGTGPNTFVHNWVMHKPAEVNQSPFWNLDFAVGFSTLLTALGTVGLLGMIAWLIPLFLVLVSLVRAIRLQVLSREERVVATIVGIASIFLMTAVIVYVPSPNLILLALLLCGATFGFLWRQGRTSAQAGGISASRLLPMASVGAAVLLLVISLGVAGMIDRRFVSQAILGAGINALNRGDADKALSYAERAYAAEKIPDALFLATSAGTLKLRQLAEDTSTAAEEIQSQFSSVAGATIATGQEGITASPQNYRAHIVLARAYDLLAQLKVQGAYENAKQGYENAALHNPNNPEIYLALARLEAVQGNAGKANEFLAKALTLKPNYTDAILFDVQLRVANNDLPNAIRSATAAVQTAPGVAPIWFELGLLYYAANDTVNAITPLQNAISLVPDYANAKYFLGLSYYAQKRANEALTLFEDLAKTNPDNQEVKLIITNMVAGRDPFASSTPPVIPPQERVAAPITQ